MFWSTMVSCDPGDCDGAADAGARPAVIPATVATIAAPPISDVIFLRAFILSPVLVGRGWPFL
jgi:hypothetical protein